jgi:glucose/arabinose dehydrogenase
MGIHVHGHRSRYRLTIAVLALATLLVAACGSGDGSAIPAASTVESSASAPATVATPAPATEAPSATRSSFDPAALTLDIETVTGGLEQPVDVAVPGDDSGIFVAEQPGRIRIVRDDTIVETPFLDIVERVASGGERGLLGLAFHPAFPDDPRLFVNYTDRDGDTVIAEYRLDDSDRDLADPDSERILLHIDQPFANHNGGAVVFGPDGMLYIATGDGGSGGDPQGNGQRLDTRLAKILRIDIDDPGTDERPYGIPQDNPFLDDPEAMPEIWLTGLRNPWRIRFDDATGDLWIGDVGQGAWEEIDVARAGASGLNFGWNRMEGFACFEPRDGCDETGLALPVAAYGHEFGCAVIGGVVVRDPDQPLLDGGYVFSDSCSGNLWAIDPTTDGPLEPEPHTDSGRGISSIGLDEDGSVLATDLGGELVRIVAGPR